MTSICEKHRTESVVRKTQTGCITHCVECQSEKITAMEMDSKLLDWLEDRGGELQFSALSCRWWCNWYAGDDGDEHKSGPFRETVRGALLAAYNGECDD